MEKHFNIKIFGKVQGVFFRYSAKDNADELNIKGFVKNESDGSVYIEAEGEGENIDTFIDWCKQGPQGAQVQRVDIKEDEIKGFKEFSIKK